MALGSIPGEGTVNKIIGKIYKLLYPLAVLYWFIRRPKTFGVKCLLTNKNEVLLLRHTYIPDVWSAPGGGVKKNEDIESAIIREVFEETGIIIHEPRLIETVTATHQYKIDTIAIFTYETTSKDYKNLSPEIEEIKWFDTSNLPKDLSWLLKPYL